MPGGLHPLAASASSNTYNVLELLCPDDILHIAEIVKGDPMRLPSFHLEKAIFVLELAS